MGQLKYLFLLVLFTAVTISQNQDWFCRNPLPQNDLFAVEFLNPATGYVCGSKGLILKTITGDNQWINQSLGTSRNLYGMYLFDANSGVIVGDSGLMVRTTNGGTNWLTVTTGLSGALRSITFTNSATGFAVGDGIIIKSTNGGANWSVNYNASQNLRSVFFVDNNTGFAAGTGGLLLKTTNCGLNWGSQFIGSSDTFNCVLFTDPLNGFIAASTGYIYRSSNGGVNWGSELYAWGTWNSIKFLNQNFGYAAGKIIMVTFNGGADWMPIPVGNEFSFFNDMCSVDTFLFTCSTKGYIYKIPNIFLGTDINIGGSMNSFSSMSFTDVNTGCIVSDDEYLRTTNGGLNWYIDLPLYRSFEGGESFIDVAFFPPSSAFRIYDLVAPTAFHEDFLQHSTDGGLTWNGPRHYSQIATVIKGVCEAWGTTYITIGFGGIGGPSPAILKNNGSGWGSVFTSSTIEFGKISFADQNTGISIFSTPNYGYTRTTNGGSYWLTSLSIFPRRPLDVQLLPSGIGYIIGDSSLFERTTDFGNSWTYVLHNISKSFIKIQFVNNNTGWIISRNYGLPNTNRLFYTSNGGSDLFQIQSLDSFNVRGMSFLNALTGYVCGDSGTIFKTTNGGLTFAEPIAINVPKNFSLSQNYPNPFNPVTKIKFDIPTPLNPPEGGTQNAFVSLIIYDILGKEIASIIPPLRGGGEGLKPGTYEVQWDGSNYPSGVYFCKLVVSGAEPLTSADYSATIKLVLLK